MGVVTKDKIFNNKGISPRIQSKRIIPKLLLIYDSFKTIIVILLNSKITIHKIGIKKVVMTLLFINKYHINSNIKIIIN